MKKPFCILLILFVFLILFFEYKDTEQQNSDIEIRDYKLLVFNRVQKAGSATMNMLLQD